MTQTHIAQYHKNISFQLEFLRLVVIKNWTRYVKLHTFAFEFKKAGDFKEY